MINHDDLMRREIVSALADGQLRGEEFASAIASMDESDEGLSAWHVYHVVGDVLRCADLANCSGDRAFVALLRGRLSASIGARPLSVTVTEVDSNFVELPAAAASGDPSHGTVASANAPTLRWKLLAGLASLAAVTAIGWHSITGDSGVGRAAQLASATGSAPLAATSAAQAGAASKVETPVMVRDPRLDELLAAHKQFGGTSALQMPSGFLRNATFESPGR